MKILTVCRANVGRSQILAALLEKNFPQHTVISAGTRVVSSATGESQHGVLIKHVKGVEHVLEVLKEEGIDWSDKVRTQLSPDMLDDVDRIIVMSEPEHIPDYLNNHPNMIYWEIADLKDTSLEFHRETREKLKKMIEEHKDLFISNQH